MLHCNGGNRIHCAFWRRVPGPHFISPRPLRLQAWVLGAAVMADAVVSTGTCSSEAGMYCAVNVLAGNVQSGFHLFMLQLPPRAIFFHEIVR